MVSAAGLASCNKDSDDNEEYIEPSNVAVTEFSIKYNSHVPGVDDTFFSIDLRHGVIFNADSLPQGSDVTKLVPTIKYSNYVTSAKLLMEGGTVRTGEVDYKANPSDSIDFSGKVTLTLRTTDNITKSYRIKVNVHRQKSDSLVWDRADVAKLPSRLGDPRSQKTVTFNKKAYTFIEERDGSHTMAISSDITKNEWTRTAVTLPVNARIRTLVASDDALYILCGSYGALYRSTDGLTWTNTGEVWNYLIGGYMDTAIGIAWKSVYGNVFAQYPKRDIAEARVPVTFPVRDHSNFVILANKWTNSPVGFMVGGVDQIENSTNATWAFDGTNWILLSDEGIPRIKGATLIPYYNYRENSEGTPLQYHVWMLFGGELEDGTFNRTIYISYDNGVNWAKGADYLQLPSVIPAMTLCDNVVLDTVKKANLSDAWTRRFTSPRMRAAEGTLEGDIISWNCPYIYLIGGVNPNGQLYDTIWRGVLNRLTFTPII